MIVEGQLVWESRGVQVEAPVRLVNVSMRGCLLKAKQGPDNEPGLCVHLKSAGIELAGGIEGEIVGVKKSLFGPRWIRIRFAEPLPFVSFKALVYGSEISHDRYSQLPDHEKDTYWR